MPLLVLLCAAQLMVILDISAVNVALPSLSADLGIGPGDLEWTITAYSLLFGSLLLLGGRAAGPLRRRRAVLARPPCSAAGACSWPAWRSSPAPRPSPRWPRRPARSTPPVPGRSSARRCSR